jgi:hypothetical protein
MRHSVARSNPLVRWMTTTTNKQTRLSTNSLESKTKKQQQGIQAFLGCRLLLSPKK